MLFKREGYPDEDELVLCTVTKVHSHAIFCNLDEFTHSGMIHISEVSPGRIRNIRDYVREDKKIVCQVLRVNTEKGHIDLSLRRVNEAQKRRKLDEIKQEQKAEKIIEILANEIKKPFKDVYEQVSKPILVDYDMIHLAFNEVVEHGFDLKELGLEKSISEKLMKIVKEKIQPKSVQISGEFKITVYDENGLEIVKSALMEAEKVSENITIKYKGGGSYIMKVVSKDYKKAEDILKKAKDKVMDYIEKKGGEVVFERHEK